MEPSKVHGRSFWEDEGNSPREEKYAVGGPASTVAEVPLGAVVMLRSGGPPMLAGPRFAQPEGSPVSRICVWFDDGGSLQMAPFPDACVKPWGDGEMIRDLREKLADVERRAGVLVPRPAELDDGCPDGTVFFPLARVDLNEDWALVIPGMKEGEFVKGRCPAARVAMGDDPFGVAKADAIRRWKAGVVPTADGGQQPSDE